MTKRQRTDRESSSSSSKPTAGAGRSAKRRLGRGLSSLISSPVPVRPASDDDGEDQASASTNAAEVSEMPVPAGTSGASAEGESPDGSELRMVPIQQIQPNPRQPRQHFDDAGLESLAASIRSAGIMQPIILRPGSPSPDDIDKNQYELVAGERRWRAAKLAGLDHVPAVVRSIDDATAAEWALIENIQREDLNPIERAEAFRRLSDEFDLTHQEIAERVGLNRASVTNLLRLLELDPETLDEVRRGELTLGHARALLAITNVSARRALVRQALRRQWSVRELERRINDQQSEQRAADGGAQQPKPGEIHLRHLAEELGRHLGTRVRIDAGRKKGSGKLVIDFYSLDEFESLLDRLGYKPS